MGGLACVGIRHPQLFGVLSARMARRAVEVGAANAGTASTDRQFPSQLLVDVSEIVKRDAGTGIQRVVRNILLHLLRKPPSGYEVKPVYASRHESYRYAEGYRAKLLGQHYDETPDHPVRTHPGDIFLGLDLAAHLLPHHHRTLGLWKCGGVQLHFLMLDLLPVRHPEWFTAKRPRTFLRWLRTLAIYADCVLCISKATADDLAQWLAEKHGIAGVSPAIRSFHLGADFPAKTPGPEQSLAADQPALRFRGLPCVLMVGTIEPRKGYAQALSAFELLWQQGTQVNLIIVGKAGWKVEALLARLRHHAEAGQRLHWFENADDELLLQLYSRSDGVLMASEAEGFGLPIVEAARFNKPLLLRDIPVFREIAGNGARYFAGLEPHSLAAALSSWLPLISAGQAPMMQTSLCQTWAQSTEQLLLAMDLA